MLSKEERVELKDFEAGLLRLGDSFRAQRAANIRAEKKVEDRKEEV